MAESEQLTIPIRCESKAYGRECLNTDTHREFNYCLYCGAAKPGRMLCDYHGWDTGREYDRYDVCHCSRAGGYAPFATCDTRNESSVERWLETGT